MKKKKSKLSTIVIPLQSDHNTLQEDINEWLEYEDMCLVCGDYANNSKRRLIHSPTVIFLQVEFRNVKKIFDGFSLLVGSNFISYKLIGVSLHSGTFMSGHYTALVEIGGKMFFCNDGSVSAGKEVHGSAKLLAFGKI